jgi:hypothetical protein
LLYQSRSGCDAERASYELRWAHNVATSGSALTDSYPATVLNAPSRIGNLDCGAPDEFHVHQFSHGDFVGAVTETLAGESITRVLYPDDSTTLGQELRFLQEYFLCACSIQDIVRRFRASNDDWNQLPEKAAVQLNDTILPWRFPSCCVFYWTRLVWRRKHVPLWPDGPTKSTAYMAGTVRIGITSTIQRPGQRWI